MKKPSEWLSEIGSHSIVASAPARKDFTDKTGVACPSWPEYSPQMTRRYIEERGVGGWLPEHPADRLAYGWLMAEAVARALVPHSGEPWTHYEGRGTRFRAAVEVLHNAGL